MIFIRPVLCYLVHFSVETVHCLLWGPEQAERVNCFGKWFYTRVRKQGHSSTVSRPINVLMQDMERPQPSCFSWSFNGSTFLVPPQRFIMRRRRAHLCLQTMAASFCGLEVTRTTCGHSNHLWHHKGCFRSIAHVPEDTLGSMHSSGIDRILQVSDGVFQFGVENELEAWDWLTWQSQRRVSQS